MAEPGLQAHSYWSNGASTSEHPGHCFRDLRGDMALLAWPLVTSQPGRLRRGQEPTKPVLVGVPLDSGHAGQDKQVQSRRESCGGLGVLVS